MSDRKAPGFESMTFQLQDWQTGGLTAVQQPLLVSYSLKKLNLGCHHNIPNYPRLELSGLLPGINAMNGFKPNL